MLKWLSRSQVCPRFGVAARLTYRRRSIGVGNVGAWIPLQVITPEYESIVSTIQAQNVSEHLPATYTEELVAGYKAQRELIAASYGRDTSGSIELPFAGVGAFALVTELFHTCS